MRFRIWMPIAQTAAMLWLMWWPGGPVKHAPQPDAVEWAKAINLPAVPVVTPIEFALREGQSLPSSRVQFYGSWLVGLLCWYMAGRFLDEMESLRKTRKLERAYRAGVAFALIALPSTILMAAAFGLGGKESRIISAWAIVWLAITATDFLFRVAQLIRHRRRPDFSRS